MSTPRMTCRELVEAVTDYLEGALHPDEKARLERHLESCTGCRNYLDHLAKVRQLAGTLSEKDVDPRAAAALMSVFRSWREDRV